MAEWEGREAPDMEIAHVSPRFTFRRTPGQTAYNFEIQLKQDERWSDIARDNIATSFELSQTAKSLLEHVVNDSDLTHVGMRIENPLTAHFGSRYDAQITLHGNVNVMGSIIHPYTMEVIDQSEPGRNMTVRGNFLKYDKQLMKNQFERPVYSSELDNNRYLEKVNFKGECKPWYNNLVFQTNQHRGINTDAYEVLTDLLAEFSQNRGFENFRNIEILFTSHTLKGNSQLVSDKNCKIDFRMQREGIMTFGSEDKLEENPDSSYIEQLHRFSFKIKQGKHQEFISGHMLLQKNY